MLAPPEGERGNEALLVLGVRRRGSFGPFMNYDQFASYMAMVLPMGLGYLGANSSRPIRAIAWRLGMA